MTEVGGHCDAVFAPVRQAFTENFDRGEIGAACTVVINGRTVVDLWGGVGPTRSNVGLGMATLS
jgi:hypothetical protein